MATQLHPLIARADTTVPVTVQTRAALGPSDAFDAIVPIDLSLVFKGWGPFPAVRGVKNQTAAWDHAGPSRNPDLSDGSTATERLTEYTAGHSFGYELTQFTGILRRFISGIRGEWTFTPDGNATMIRWTYEFKPLRGRDALVRFGIAPLWRRYMQLGVEAAARIAEENLGGRGALLPDQRPARSAGLTLRGA
ncbi:MAG: SRPBCC family protein [Gemmatimonadaceae bacterium]|nr:SRPBCC family protein [Gemmatimonadaceae bacterium]